MTLTYHDVLPHAILSSSIILIIVSLTSFAITGHAFYLMATHFPGDEYIWFGPPGSPFDSWNFRMVTLAYDWSTEDLIFVSSGISVVAGLFGVVTWVQGRRAEKVILIPQCVL